MKRFIAATLYTSVLAAFSFSVSAGDMPCFEAPEFVVPTFEQAQFEQSEFVQSEFEKPTFVKAEFYQPEFVQAEFVQPEFVAPEFQSQCSSARAAVRPSYGSGTRALNFSRSLISQKSSGHSESTTTVPSLARFNGEYVAKSLQTARYRYLLDAQVSKRTTSAALFQSAPVDDCPCHAHKTQSAANQAHLAIR